MRALVALLLAVAISGCTAQSSSSVSGGPAGLIEQTTVSVGETVDFSMSTHCGVESASINGRVWNAVDPLYSSHEKLGPPPGWGDPYQNGTLTLESPERAVFAALGERVVLAPSKTNGPLRPCN